MAGRSAQSQRAGVLLRSLSAERPCGAAVKETLSCDGMVRKNERSARMAVVKDPLLPDDNDVQDECSCGGDVDKCPLSCDGCTLPIGMRCSEVGNSVLCNLDCVKDPSAQDMGSKLGSACLERYDQSCCSCCALNLSVACEVGRARVGSGAAVHPQDQGSVCDAGPVRYWAQCSECGDASWKDQVTDSRCNRRRRCRGIVWWLLLVLLGAAPLASGQLRPNTDITISRSEGGKLCMPKVGLKD
jgi:hypothetical protein